MKFFKKRSVALILCVLVVLGSTVLNTRWKLGDDCEELDALFRSKDGIAVQLETLQEQGIENAKVRVMDRGALDCVIRVRVETAVMRAEEVAE